MTLTKADLELGLVLSNARGIFGKLSMDAKAKLKEDPANQAYITAAEKAEDAYSTADKSYFDWLHLHGHLLIETALGHK